MIAFPDIMMACTRWAPFSHH